MSDTRVDPKLAGVIEEARKRSGLTKYRLAVRSGLSLQTVRTACQGIATTRTLAAIARTLGVDVDALMGHRDPAAPRGESS